MNQSNKTQGFLLLLIFVCLGTFFLNGRFAMEFNSLNLIRTCSLFGIIGIGVLFVIVTGGIDLSLGSLIGLVGASLVLLLRLNPVETLQPLGQNQWRIVWFFWLLIGLEVASSVYWGIRVALAKNFRIRKLIFPALFLCMALLSIQAMWVANSDAPNTSRIPWIFFLLISISLNAGLLHGVLITHFKLQPFVVTLGGLLWYRGLVRWLTNDETQGLRSVFDGSLALLGRGEICSVSTLMTLFGFILAALYLFQLLFRSQEDADQRRGSWVGLTCGLMVGLIGSSRFWNGFLRENFTLLFDLDFGFTSLSFSTWDTTISEVAIQRPQWLMQWAWVPLIPVGLLMVWGLVRSILQSERSSDIAVGAWKSQLGWLPWDFFWLSHTRRKHRWNHLIVALGGLAVTSILLWRACEFQPDMGEVKFTTQQWWSALITIFGALALVMISVSRLGSCVQRHGDGLAKFCYPVASLLAVLAIVGTTELPTTMVQTPFFIMVALAFFAMIIFEHTVFGRYLLAIGNNEDAARYSGINTQEVTVAAYVICSGITGIAAIIMMLECNSVAPTGFGSFYELYAIAAVVLGGCSLRGGEANPWGVLLGAAIMRVLYNAPDMIDLPKTIIDAILGIVIVVGVIVDEQIRRR